MSFETRGLKKAHYPPPGGKIIGEEVHKYWKVDENDPEIKALIDKGKITFSHLQRYFIEEDGKRVILY